MAEQHTILLVGESNVGKTHYGAQFLKRLMVKACALKMHGAPTNLEAFTTALGCLTEGKATDHTPASSYVESVWCQRRFKSDPLSCLIAEVNLTHPGSFDCAARARRA